jgi:hypothetical protein
MTSLVLFDAAEYTQDDLVQVITEQLAYDGDTLAGNLRTAVMYCPKVMTSGEFARAAAECGVNPGTARNRHSEIRRWQRDMGEI